jgi:diacylglycerol kinase (ATP)
VKARREGEALVAVINNPKSRQNREDPSIAPGLVDILGGHGELVSPDDLPALAATAERFRARGVELVAVHGGDGTVHQVMTAVARAYAGHDLPSFLLLRGGTMNIVADSVGMKLEARTALSRLVRAVRAGQRPPSTRRYVLEVDLGGGEPPLYGFLVGNGIIARFLEEYYARPEPTPRDAAGLLSRAALSALVGGPLARRLARPFRGGVTVDGQVLPGDQWVAVAVGSIEQMGLGFRVFPDLKPDVAAFQYVALGGSLADVAWELPSVFRGRGVHRPGNRSGLGADLELLEAGPLQLMVDGDFYTAPSGRVRVRIGPPVTFLLP